MCSIDNLVIRIQDGDNEEAFVFLERKIKPLMYTIYYRHFYYCVELEDFIQEASLLLFYTAQKFKFEKGKSFIAYYTRSLKNYAIQLIRHEHRRRVIPGTQLCKYDISNIKYNYSIEEEFLLKEEISSYWYSLSSFEKAVLIYHMKGYTFDEISEKTNKSLSSIKGAYNRCHKKFKFFYNNFHKE